MGITSSSLAAGVGSAVENVQFKTSTEVLTRRILIVGTYDPSKTSVVDEVPVRIFSDAHAGDLFGFGSMLHRLAVKAFKGSLGVETWCLPQTELGDYEVKVMSVVVGTVGAGTISIYLNGDLVSVAVTAGMTADEIVTAIAAAVNADASLPFDAVADTGTDEVEFTTKSKGAFWGNFSTVELDLGAGDAAADPSGVTIGIATTQSGAGTPDMDDALEGLGTGEEANNQFFTDVVHGYGQVTAVLDAISNYVGSGDEKTGLYAETVHRPFRS